MSKETPTRAFFPGYVVPAALALLVLINVLTGRVYLPVRGGPIAVYTDGWRVSGTILLKLGFALGLFAWYVLANDDRLEHLAQPLVAVAALVAIVGLVLFAVGFAG